MPEASVSCPGSGQEGGWACPDLRDEKTERSTDLPVCAAPGEQGRGSQDPEARGITPFCKPGGSHTERSRGRAVRPPEREMGGGGNDRTIQQEEKKSGCSLLPAGQETPGLPKRG